MQLTSLVLLFTASVALAAPGFVEDRAAAAECGRLCGQCQANKCKVGNDIYPCDTGSCAGKDGQMCSGPFNNKLACPGGY